MGSWLLLGVDSLIACVAVGPIMERKLSMLVPFALLFGVADGGGYLLGTVLPWLLCLDNITYGAVDGVSKSASVGVSALEQALSSAIQAGVGLAIGIAIVYSIPALRRHLWLANATAGGLMIVGAGVLHAVG